MNLLQHLNWADYAIIGLVSLSALISLARGLIREAISLATWIVAVWIGIRFSPFLAQALTPYVHTPSMRMIIAFAVLLLSALLIGGLVNLLFSRLIDGAGLDGFDRLLGLVFGVARGLFLVAVLVLLGNMSEVSKDPWWINSQLIPHFQGWATWLHGFVPEQLSHLTKEWNLG